MVEGDEVNRLTNLSIAHLGTTIGGYEYTLNASGHRTQVGEFSGRTVSYQYDDLYRLTRETVAAALVSGVINYEYDAVGNRLTRDSTLVNIVSKLYTYDMNPPLPRGCGETGDRLGSDTYDESGNTVAASLRDAQSGTETPFTYTYDFENRIIQADSASTAIDILYDGDGNRVKKTVNGVTVYFLVDDRNPSGYVQVMEELSVIGSQLSVDRTYTYGLDLISQDRPEPAVPGGWASSFYVYDGHGSVRALTDLDGNITDTYDYDAFGTLIYQQVYDVGSGGLVEVSPSNQSLITDNRFLYCGEQFDPDLGLYFLRARYMDTDRGRFWSMDDYWGPLWNPVSLHRYLYGIADPVNFVDPSGHYSTLGEVMINVGLMGTLTVLVYAAQYSLTAQDYTGGDVTVCPGYRYWTESGLHTVVEICLAGGRTLFFDFTGLVEGNNVIYLILARDVAGRWHRPKMVEHAKPEGWNALSEEEAALLAKTFLTAYASEGLKYNWLNKNSNQEPRRIVEDVLENKEDPFGDE